MKLPAASHGVLAEANKIWKSYGFLRVIPTYYEPMSFLWYNILATEKGIRAGYD
ncbi:MAG: hypothetical protein KAJ66_04985 [Candidatus Omnitrophica bacterium]|nr:hypothetical protein [Candidatus Omnitrophota bacterium]